MTTKATGGFHDRGFDDETLLKLKIFRKYVREWLPVFLVSRSRPYVNVFDFFAGPGGDAAGNPGSPVIMLEEARAYYLNCKVDPTVKLAMYFNDKDEGNAERLRERVAQFPVDSEWTIQVENLDFPEAFGRCLPRIADRDSASLVIIDQFGFKHMPPEVFANLASCGTTDLICFMSSSYIRRFISEPSTQRYVPIPPEEMKQVPASEIHRYVCEYFRSLVPPSVDYHIAPFSIRSQANVYGLIYGSRSLLGLQKFLSVCWGFDEFTGEANFPIDADPIVANPDQPSLFAEYNVPKKQRDYSDKLLAFLAQGGKTNMDVYRFTLESGFLPRHTNALLKTLQDNGMLIVKGVDGAPVHRGNYYVSWDQYKTGSPRVVFTYKGSVK